jgi:hypothetical protein
MPGFIVINEAELNLFEGMVPRQGFLTGFGQGFLTSHFLKKEN